ncbi:hypothetical protein [Citrifermentans bremense]|uniref:hypothetical protein n=1 Tax=Citrifermentans bremense TaxID=60035 RepID=UPI00047C4903|nr:hypothetical protein [Citrifermentans bremense]
MSKTSLKMGVIGGAVALTGSFLPLFSISMKGGEELFGALGRMALNLTVSTIGGFAWLLPLATVAAFILAVYRLQKGAFDNDRWVITGVCATGIVIPIIIGINGKNALSNLAGLAQSFAGNDETAAQGIKTFSDMISVSPSYGLFMVVGGCLLVLVSSFNARPQHLETTSACETSAEPTLHRHQ